MNRCFKGLVTLAFASCLMMTGCSGLTSTGPSTDIPKTPVEQAEEYVSSIDSHAAEISKKADEFITAIGKSDTVAAKLKFEEITAALDECANVEIPETLNDEGEKYKQACTNLKDALSALYDVANGKVAEADVQAKVQEAQDKYTEAAKALEEADKTLKDKVDELKNGNSTKPSA